MKRTESKTPLQTYETSGKELRIYWDEQVVERPGMDDEPPETFYSYATASAQKATGYSALVTDIIRSQYTPDQEFAAINSGGDRYQALLDFRVLAKQLARGYLGLPEPSVEDQRKEAILTRARFKLALLEGGYLEDVEEAYPSWPKAVQIMWDDSSTFERLHPELLALAAAMGYTDEQVDAIFGLAEFSSKLNVNTATLEELDALSGVGPALAQAIIDGRPWADVDDLTSINGISQTMVDGWGVTV